MPIYHRLGEIPHKRHTQFRKPDGNLYREQLKGTRGFDGASSLLYHLRMPTATKAISSKSISQPEIWDVEVRHHHLRTTDVPVRGDIRTGRVPVLINEDVTILLCRPEKSMDDFYRNSDCDEVLFVHEGKGILHSAYGQLPFRPGDYIVVPRGTIYQMELQEGSHRFYIIESGWQIEIPKKYRNEQGQFLEHSPYCERDIRCPKDLEPVDETGEFPIRVKARGKITTFMLDHHPFDVVGWDGYLYPWIFNIEDFEPITGRIHQPPPVHLTFQTERFVICSFVPRLFDYHPLSIPAPYYHHNVDSDEILYYVKGEFMSRKGIEVNSISYHPGAVPHGPQPGKVEASIGAKETNELAVMIDTFRPLKLTMNAKEMDDPEYPYSWIE